MLLRRIALVLEVARMTDEARAQREAMARIAAALAGEVGMREVAQTAVELAVSELGADGANAWAADPAERVLELLATVGYPEQAFQPFRRLSFDAPALAAKAATAERIQIVEDVQDLPEDSSMSRLAFTAAGIASVVAVPLIARGRLMGVLGFGSKLPHRWSAEELTLVTTLADLLASAILNARLYEESERRRLLVEAVLDNSPAAIAVMLGPEHRYTLVNPAREHLFGIPMESQLGRTPLEIFPDLAGSPPFEALDRVYNTGESTVIPEFRYHFATPGKSRDVSVLYTPLRGPDGRVEGVISLMLDITEAVATRRKLEDLTDQLRSANQQLVAANLRSSDLADLAGRRAAEMEATIANIADAVFVCDPEGKILLINRTGREMIGVEQTSDLRSLADYLGAARLCYLDGELIPPQELAITRALRGEVVRGMEELIHDARSRQDRYILASAAPVRDEQGNSLGAVEVHSDITRLKELDLLKDQFITVAAHEIKTPVTAIKGFAQALIRASDASAPGYRKALETIVRQSDRIDALLQDFLEVSRMRWGRVDLSQQRIDLPALVAESVAGREGTAPKHRLVLTRKDPVWVKGDRERLAQVVANLLDNATRYSPQGGEVEVQVRREGDRAVVSVRDQGVGIARDRQPHVFDRFYRAHLGTAFDYGGLGVGLYISREIILRHGGEMGFESEEGRGSTFYFAIPALG